MSLETLSILSKRTDSRSSSNDNAVIWNCHCCLAVNEGGNKCYCCGRPENWAQDNYSLPLHGKLAPLFRPSQIVNVLQDVNEVDSEKWTPLHAACAKNNLAVVKELIRLKSEVNARTDHGLTPLHLAVYAGASEIVDHLLLKKAMVDPISEYEKMTPLHYACQGGWKHIAHTLIHHNASVNALNLLGRTPLHLAAKIGRTDIGAMLLLNRAKPDTMDAHGWSARQIAELHQHRKFQELMVRITMSETQPVIKDLPKAPWHGTLWDDVVTMQRTREDEARVEVVKAKRLEEEIAEYRRRAKEREQQEKFLRAIMFSEGSRPASPALVVGSRLDEESQAQGVDERADEGDEGLVVKQCTPKLFDLDAVMQGAAAAKSSKPVKWRRYAGGILPPLSLLGLPDNAVLPGVSSTSLAQPSVQKYSVSYYRNNNHRRSGLGDSMSTLSQQTLFSTVRPDDDLRKMFDC